MKKKARKMTKAQISELNEYNKWRVKNGLHSVTSLKYEKYKPDFKEYVPKPNPNYRSSRHIPSHMTNSPLDGTRSSIMDRTILDKESKDVRDAILAKSKRIAQMYNKGGYQYIGDDVDVTTIGTRNRRM